MNKIKYLNKLEKSELTIWQQLALGIIHCQYWQSQKRWKNHIMCTGLTVRDRNPIAVKKLTTHIDSHYIHRHIDDIVTQGIGTHRVMGNCKPMKDKEIGYYVDRYCTSCGSLLIRHDPDTLRCPSCKKRYKT